jgi:hypothetical protein
MELLASLCKVSTLDVIVFQNIERRSVNIFKYINSYFIYR